MVAGRGRRATGAGGLRGGLVEASCLPAEAPVGVGGGGRGGGGLAVSLAADAALVPARRAGTGPASSAAGAARPSVFRLVGSPPVVMMARDDVVTTGGADGPVCARGRRCDGEPSARDKRDTRCSVGPTRQGEDRGEEWRGTEGGKEGRRRGRDIHTKLCCAQPEKNNRRVRGGGCISGNGGDGPRKVGWEKRDWEGRAGNGRCG